jgi:type I site-specific restriction endonuclease
LKDRDEVDYLLFVDGKAIVTVEAKPESRDEGSSARTQEPFRADDTL